MQIKERLACAFRRIQASLLEEFMLAQTGGAQGACADLAGTIECCQAESSKKAYCAQ